MHKMKYGCIGRRLTHSFSKEIHAHLSDYSYELKELEPSEVREFMTEKDFLAINVTIPYKETVIPYLSEIDPHAAKIGAVNTVVKRDGKLYGYNTDFYGMSELIRHTGIEIKGRTAAILGTGGTSKTAFAVLSALGAKKLLIVSRTPENGEISYSQLAEMSGEVEIIVNTTPVGMFPKGEERILDLSIFKRLEGVIDAVYNPLCTNLVLDARALGVKSEGGLYMLVAQGVRASELFLGIEYPEGTCERVYRQIFGEKENIVLIGMPTSGKSAVGKALSTLTGRMLLDTDELIESECGADIPTIFKNEKEEGFRRIEEHIIRQISQENGKIIATGGGIVEKSINIHLLKMNGRLYYLAAERDRLFPDSGRPLSSTEEDLDRLYRRRQPLYTASADATVTPCESVTQTAEKIILEHRK